MRRIIFKTGLILLELFRMRVRIGKDIDYRIGGKAGYATSAIYICKEKL